MLPYLVILLSYFFTESFCNDDYENLQKTLIAARQSRAANPSDQMDGLYSIESAANGLYLTAKNGVIEPGPVVLRKWADSANQIWGATKFDTSRGYNLKPLSNEYNTVTSSMVNNAHAYNPMEFKKQKKDNSYVIFNSLNKRCLQTGSSTKKVIFEKCKPASNLQHWKLHVQE